MKSILALGFPAGKPLYTTLQTKAMTAGTDTVVLEVPAGKRWLVYWAVLKNNSGVTIDCYIRINDDASTMLINIAAAGLADGALIGAPWKEGTADTAQLGHGAFPLVLDAGMELVFGWAANAGKSGNSYWFAKILEL